MNAKTPLDGAYRKRKRFLVFPGEGTLGVIACGGRSDEFDE
jgi:hypothetical protein